MIWFLIIYKIILSKIQIYNKNINIMETRTVNICKKNYIIYLNMTDLYMNKRFILNY